MQVNLLSFQKHKRMSVVQFASREKNTLDYISGPLAVKNELVQVKEVSQSGSVNELFVFNLSDKFVFFMDGDILIGAKQNRVLNTSVLLAPNSKINLPVSCVEQGRWDNLSFLFHSSDNIAPSKLRANKARAVKESQERKEGSRANQYEVWSDVEEYAFSLKSPSPSMNLNYIYEKNRDSFDDFMKAFSIDQDANGLAVFTDNKLLFMDLFNRTDIYNEYFPKLLKSSAMEISLLEQKENKIEQPEAYYKTNTLLDSVHSSLFTIHRGVGVGEEKRFSREDVTGFILNYNEHLVHLTALNIERKNEGKDDHRRNRIH